MSLFHGWQWGRGTAAHWGSLAHSRWKIAYCPFLVFCQFWGRGKGPIIDISKTIGCMAMKFLQVDGVLNLNIFYTVIVMAKNSEVVMTSVVKTKFLKRSKKVFFRIISGCSVHMKYKVVIISKMASCEFLLNVFKDKCFKLVWWP